MFAGCCLINVGAGKFDIISSFTVFLLRGCPFEVHRDRLTAVVSLADSTASFLERKLLRHSVVEA